MSPMDPKLFEQVVCLIVIVGIVLYFLIKVARKRPEDLDD